MRTNQHAAGRGTARLFIALALGSAGFALTLEERLAAGRQWAEATMRYLKEPLAKAQAEARARLAARGAKPVDPQAAVWLKAGREQVRQKTLMQMAQSFGPTDLWLEIEPTGDAVLLTMHNTTPGLSYQILSRQHIASGGWVVEQDLVGASGQNWTQVLGPRNQRPELFFGAGTSDDTDGDGLSDATEYVITHTDPLNADTGDTGTSDGYRDSDGDGWTNLDEMRNRTNPNEFSAPPVPQPFNAFLNLNGSSATLTWNPSPGPVLHYLIERADPQSGFGDWGDFHQIAEIDPGETLFEDTSAPIVQDPDSAYFLPSFEVYNSVYRIRGIYAGGQSQTADAILNGGDPDLAVDARLVRNSTGRWQLICPNIPARVAQLRLNWFWWDYFWDFGGFLSSQDVPVANLTAGVYVIPDAEIISHLSVVWDSQVGPVPAEGQLLWVQGVEMSGRPGVAVNAGLVFQDAPYFVDGREHLKQNLKFQLRAATITQPCTVSDSAYWNPFFASIGVPADTHYVEASIFHPTIQFKGYDYRPGGNSQSDYIQLNNLWPFNVNYQLHGRLDDPNNSVPASFEWQPDFVTIPAPAVLDVGEPHWISQDVNNLADVAAGISGDSLFLQSGAHNLYGLAFGSAYIQGGGVDPATGLPFPNPVEGILAPGASLALNSQPVTAFYNQTTDPVLEAAGYYFAPILTSGTELLGYGPAAANQPYPLPVNLGFASANQTPVMVASVGQTIIIGGWERFAVNGSAGKFAYLGQYFDKAYKMDPVTGQRTTTETGILSEYGEFFPTEPGRVILTTKPDTDQGGLQGECLVHVIKIQLDVNHDGNMDLSFAGPDNTVPERPFRFWVNNDLDSAQGDVNAPWTADSRNDFIESERDLEDFARLWISGLPELPGNQGYEVSLSWRAVSGQPSIKLYNSFESDGGTLYLTDENTAQAIVQSIFRISYGTVSAGHDLVLPFGLFTGSGHAHLLFEGVGTGKGELVLAIKKDNETLATTSVHLELLDVKQMYERAHIENVLRRLPQGNPSPVTSRHVIDNPLPVDPTQSKQLIVFVHGWRMGQWDYENFSETMFKRLYWQGYQGRFAALRWPTLSKDDYLLPISDFFSYNHSEYIAFKSGIGSSQYLSRLRARFPDHAINVAAHSMGGIVMMEALKEHLALGRREVDNCVLMQAAVPAHCFDGFLNDYPDFNIPSNPTPDTYRWYPGAIHNALNGDMANFFNPDDFALVTGRIPNPIDISISWEGNQKSYKPDTGINYYANATQGLYRTIIDVLLPLSDPHEIMSFCARPRSKAVGASSGVGGEIHSQEVDLKRDYGFTADVSHHSGQFNRNIQQLSPFYRRLLEALNP